MKNLILIVIIIFSFECYSNELIRIRDTQGDEYGAGNITHPQDPYFTMGMFDFKELTISDKGQDYLFEIEIYGKFTPFYNADIKYDKNLPDEFYSQLIHIYIDTDGVKKSGFSETIMGTKTSIHPDDGWEKAIVFSSLADRYRGALGSRMKQISKRVYLPKSYRISPNNRKLSFKIPKNFLGEYSNRWGIVCIMMNHDYSMGFSKNIYVHEIGSTEGLLKFGGGLTRNVDPNVLDVFDTPLHNQNPMLKSYDVDKEKYATLYAVYPEKNKKLSAQSIGEIVNITTDKIIISLGAIDGVSDDSKFLIENKYKVIPETIFDEVTIVSIFQLEDVKLEKGMKVTIWNE